MLKSLFCAAAVVFTLPFAANATIISDGDIDISLQVISSVADVQVNNLDGAIVYDVLTAFDIGSGLDRIQGNIQSRVVDPNSGGGLIFGFRLRDLAFAADPLDGSLSSLSTFTLSGFSAFPTVDAFSISSTTFPGSKDVQSVSRNGGDLIFDVSNLDTTAGSAFTFVKVDIENFVAGPFGQIATTSASTQLNPIAAPAPVPLPASALLFVSALGVLRRRRH